MLLPILALGAAAFAGYELFVKPKPAAQPAPQPTPNNPQTPQGILTAAQQAAQTAQAQAAQVVPTQPANPATAILQQAQQTAAAIAPTDPAAATAILSNAMAAAATAAPPAAVVAANPTATATPTTTPNVPYGSPTLPDGTVVTSLDNISGTPIPPYYQINPSTGLANVTVLGVQLPATVVWMSGDSSYAAVSVDMSRLGGIVVPPGIPNGPFWAQKN